MEKLVGPLIVREKKNKILTLDSGDLLIRASIDNFNRLISRQREF